MSNKTTFSATFVCLAVIFCVCLVTSNIFVPRLFRIGLFNLQLTSAIILFPISYIINDCLTEVYGYKKARLVIWVGFAMSLFVAVISEVATLLPAPLYEDSKPAADAFNSLFKMVPRTSSASLLAFIAGSTINAFIMSKMKIAGHGKGFGWRAILSTIGGEFTDSLVFYPIAFAGMLPAGAIVSLMLTQVTVKTLYEVIMLPVTARIVKWLKKSEGLDTYDNGISYNPFRIADLA